MKIQPPIFNFTAQICDSESGALLLPDVETQLLASVENNIVSVDRVYMQDHRPRHEFIHVDDSTDPWVQRLAATIRGQALDDESFLAHVLECYEVPYQIDPYIRQHRLRFKDVL
ncbi:hypothetical protein [Bartonella sp. LJL80]